MLSSILLGLLRVLTDNAPAQDSPQVVIPVSSPAFYFSPGNWSGDSGRGGDSFRQTWNPGAYFRVAWTTNNAEPTATLLLDAPSADSATPPRLTYCLDGVWSGDVPCAAQIPLKGIVEGKKHLLTVYVQSSEQKKRWGSSEASGQNVVRIRGLSVDTGSEPGKVEFQKRWALIIGDSITEGISAGPRGADNLACWSAFLGQGLQALGYEYGISACGYNGWLRPGDMEGDVPAYYFVSDGSYDGQRSRWDKIDARNSLLDSAGQISADGALDHPPSLIVLNLGTNDGLKKVNEVDFQLSVKLGLEALKKAAPPAKIIVIIPFGQYEADALRSAVQACESDDGASSNLRLIDLGPAVAKALEKNGYWGGLHPNMRGHAMLAARILAQVVAKTALEPEK